MYTVQMASTSQNSQSLEMGTGTEVQGTGGGEKPQIALSQVSWLSRPLRDLLPQTDAETDHEGKEISVLLRFE